MDKRFNLKACNACQICNNGQCVMITLDLFLKTVFEKGEFLTRAFPPLQRKHVCKKIYFGYFGVCPGWNRWQSCYLFMHSCLQCICKIFYFEYVCIYLGEMFHNNLCNRRCFNIIVYRFEL